MLVFTIIVFKLYTKVISKPYKPFLSKNYIYIITIVPTL